MNNMIINNNWEIIVPLISSRRVINKTFNIMLYTINKIIEIYL